MITHAQRYKWAGLRRGLTVAEWERLAGLPAYSVCPEARDASGVHTRGFFMYRKATDEERAALDAAGGAAGKARLHKIVDPKALFEARRECSRKYYEKKANAA